MTDPLTTVVSDTCRLLALFDAIADSPVNGSLQLHDADGSVVKTLKAWASARSFAVAYKHNKRDRIEAWDSFSVDFSPGRFICVHGSTHEASASNDDDQMWSPAQAVAS